MEIKIPKPLIPTQSSQVGLDLVDNCFQFFGYPKSAVGGTNLRFVTRDTKETATQNYTLIGVMR